MRRPIQSQGVRNNNMCRKHYIAYQKETNPDLADEIVKELAMAGKKKRAQCSVEGCPKQSQGRVCNGMCRAHFVASGGDTHSDAALWPKQRMEQKKSPAKMPPMKAQPTKARVRVTTSEGDETERQTYLCRVEGCTKQSQGGRNNHMCRRHYTLYLDASGDVDNEGFAPADPSKDFANGAEEGKKARRKSCAIVGCRKQSQGKQNLYMCRFHFRAMEKAGISTEELPHWQQSQQMEEALQADSADFAAAVDAMPPLPDAEVAVADAGADADADAAAARGANDDGDDNDKDHDNDFV